MLIHPISFKNTFRNVPVIRSSLQTHVPQLVLKLHLQYPSQTTLYCIGTKQVSVKWSLDCLMNVITVIIRHEWYCETEGTTNLQCPCPGQQLWIKPQHQWRFQHVFIKHKKTYKILWRTLYTTQKCKKANIYSCSSALPLALTHTKIVTC